MKIMIGVDMEGITGVTNWDQVSYTGRRYAEGVELACGDVNATIEGLVAAGVDEIVVWDGHAQSHNLDLPRLHPAATYRRGGFNGIGTRWHGLDDSFGGLILLGYHARAGTRAAVLEHTMSGDAWFRLRVNGREIGELGIDAALAGAVGVPVIMTSGCDKLCREASELLGGELVAVCVKRSHARFDATCLPPAATAPLLRDGAAEAVRRIGRVKPFDLGSPAEVELTYKQTDQADSADLRLFDARRMDGYTVRWRCPSFAAWMGFTMKNPPPTEGL